MTDPLGRTVNTEPHADPTEKPEAEINEDIARLFQKTSRASFQYLAIVFRGFYTTLVNRDDAREGNCQRSACGDTLNVMTAGAAVGLVSQWLSECGTTCGKENVT